MSTTALTLKKAQTENYFLYHPDSVAVSIVGSESTFPALFDHSYDNGSKDTGNVTLQRKKPVITFYSDYCDLLTAQTTQITLSGQTKTFTIGRVRKDETGGTFQGEAWLV